MITTSRATRRSTSPATGSARASTENFDKRLQLLLIRHESPVDAWNSAARRLQSEEEQEALVERLGGGRLVQPAPSAVEASGADGATPAALPNSAAERSATPDGLTRARASLRTSSTSDEQSAAPPQTSERHAEYLEELRRRIADLDDKAPATRRATIASDCGAPRRQCRTDRYRPHTVPMRNHGVS